MYYDLYMGYQGKYQEKQLAINLRSQGLSYSEIYKHITVSKDTLSRWCRDVLLDDNQIKLLQQKRINGGQKGGIVASENKKRKRIKITERITRDAIIEIGRLNDREIFLVGVALYLGEGLKGDCEVGFTNGNTKVIEFMMFWFRKVCKVAESKFRGQIWIHDNLDMVKAKHFWHKLTGIPLSQFRKTYIAKNNNNSKKIRKQIHENGIFAIKISDVKLQRRILGWCAGILDQVKVKS